MEPLDYKIPQVIEHHVKPVIGKNIKKFRKNILEMSQAAFGKKCGVSQGAVSSIEAGNSFPSIFFLYRSGYGSIEFRAQLMELFEIREELG